MRKRAGSADVEGRPLPAVFLHSESFLPKGTLQVSATARAYNDLEMPVDAPRPTPLQLVTLAQASAIVNLSKRTLQRAIAARRLRAHVVGRRVRIDVEELERWVMANGAAPASGTSTAR